MAQVTFTNGITSLWGAIDSVKDGKRNGYRVVVRRHDYGDDKNYDADGNKWHELYYYHFHEGPWSEGATRNREMIKEAQKAAHAVERDPELRPLWEAAYADYKSSLPEGETAYHFYNFVFVTIYRDLRLRG